MPHPPRPPRRVRIPAVARWALPGLLALAVVPPARALPPPARGDSLESYADGLAAFGFPAQILVAEGDSVLLERASGTADSTGRPIGPATTFAVGSITKSVTGALVVRLARRGLLDLDDRLGSRLSDVPADKADITLLQLLSHTSGLPMDGETVDASDGREEVVRKLLREPLRFPPGSRFGYSNAGYQLLAAVLERASGRTFAELARRELLAPAGMRATDFGSAAARRRADAADGRNEWAFVGSIRDWRQRWAGTGAGDMITTAHDLWRWARALQGAGPLLPAELDTMLARRAAIGRGMFYGCGVYLVPSPQGRDLISIGGDVPGYHAAAWAERRPPWRITVVVTAEERFGRSLEVHAVQRTLWRLLDHEPAPLPPETLNWPQDRLEALAGRWVGAGGGSLILRAARGGLRLELSGSGLLDVALGPDSTGERARLGGRAERVVRAALVPDDSALAAVLHPVERELWEKSLRSGLARYSHGGTLLGVVNQGTIDLPWLPRGTRTYLRLRFAAGDVSVSLAWLDGALLDVAFDEGRPAPVLLPVAPIAAGGLAAWDMTSGLALRLEPFRGAGGTGMRVTGPGGLVILRRPEE